MGRQLRRAEGRKKDPTYTLTKSQLESMVEDVMKEKIKEVKRESMKEAVSQSMVILFALPLEVLMDHYWKKSYQKKLPEFTNHLLEYYEKWENGELTTEQLKNNLWERGGIRFEYGDQ